MFDSFETSFRIQSEVAEVGIYLMEHPQATYCHHPGWESVLQHSYGRQLRVLLSRNKDGALTGACPIVNLNGWFFGKQWVSLPYMDFGGPLASSPEAEKVLVEVLTQEAGIKGCRLQIRSGHPLQYYSLPANEKRAMILSLNDLTEEAYWKKLDARVRNQVRKAEKSEVILRRGGMDQIDGFYPVFCANMREHGSPVHARRFFEMVLAHIPGSEIVTAWRRERCIGGLVRIRFRDTLAIPWASTLKEERVHCPNNALYYDSIRTAFREKLKRVDFGRSSLGEGTYRYKIQWLAEASPLAWYSFGRDGKMLAQVRHPQSSNALRMGSNLWKNLPPAVTNWLGPRLRPYFAA